MGVTMQEQSTSAIGRWRWALALSMTGMAATGISVAVLSDRGQPPTADAPPVELPAVTAVTALGRLEPDSEVVRVAPSERGAKVAELLVSEGDRVAAGDAIAYLETRGSRAAALAAAEQTVQVAAANLAIVQAGAKQGEIAAQEAEIRRLEAELEGERLARAATVERLRAELLTAESDLRRNQFLADEGAISESALDTFVLGVATARERLGEGIALQAKTIRALERQIQEANATLDRITEVRPVDVQLAVAELEKARADVMRAAAELELATVRAPIDGQVIDVLTRAGEAIAENEATGIIELGQTQRMVAVAEVYESDIGSVRLGQPAIAVSENGTFAGELHGTVARIGLKIGKKDVLDTDPAASVDARVVEVRILLDPEDSDRVSGLTNSQVIVKIER
ncbi:ABC exporter membrane fusion protein, devB family [Rubidibacter lacunae KORDI 51-2]|uniref:ABC exporter membrane fusion protein, devB family n=1 Tax=Rubidibacter lacunae KORDI 51-2 TaxID=582515 RepID=U5DK16_9CHRO|nr:HlyD family efflux transporter periplasmic adaptor subunit [Rubidibacter lacunae]ERN40025.1 ABC exporter membrane fusion protein, devB family [Rubidibacter lacunae KORDI 51-2]